MGFGSEEWTSYLDTTTGTVTSVSEEAIRAAENADRDTGSYYDCDEDEIEAAAAILEDTKNRFRALPAQFDVHEYQIMEGFCGSVESQAVSARLSRAIQGRGAFRRFKDAVLDLGIAEQWYEFRDEALKQIAIDWCESQQIAFMDDTARKPAGKTEASPKESLYQSLREPLRALLEGERDWIANAANFAAMLFHNLPEVGWVGFYIVKEVELVLGPFQGKPACTRIRLGRGVCGTAAAQQKTLLVPNVHEFPGHIACDGGSNSEIVIPIMKDDRVVAVLDLDSHLFDRFDAEDQAGLEMLIQDFIALAPIPNP
jgi:GAF domain-containing protein